MCECERYLSFFFRLMLSLVPIVDDQCSPLNLCEIIKLNLYKCELLYLMFKTMLQVITAGNLLIVS